MEFISHSYQETVATGELFAKELKPGNVVALFGGLGMGKTAFVRGIAKGLDIKDNVSSPTFALVHEYNGKLPVYHFDMYRVTSFDDLYSTGFFDFLESDSVCVIEWSENIQEALPDTAIRVYITRGEKEDDRVITINNKQI